MVEQPAPGDWIICVVRHEGSQLREVYPGALVLPAVRAVFRGRSLRQRVFVTLDAIRALDLDELANTLAVCALPFGGDHTIRVLPRTVVA